MKIELADSPDRREEVRTYLKEIGILKDGQVTFRPSPDLEGFFLEDLDDGRRMIVCWIGELPQVPA